MPLTQVDQGLLSSTAQYTGFKNRIINGAMVIDQRNAGASVTPASGDYTLDRWRAFAAQTSKYTVQQNAGSVTPPVGFKNYLGITSSSSYSVVSGDFFFVGQQIEGLNTFDLAWGTANAQTVTVSFWVRSSLTGTFGGVVCNSAQDRSYPFSYTISAANTWEQKSVTIAGDTSGTWLTTNGTGLWLKFGIGVGSSYSGTAGVWSSTQYLASVTGATSVVGTNGATFYITGVQLEKGSTATSFDYRPYGTELALCQRYYQIIRTGMCIGNTTTQVIVSSPLSPDMRTSPSLGVQGPIDMGSGTVDRTQSSGAVNGLNYANNAAVYLLPNYSGLTATAPYQFRMHATSNGVTASAEL
jgi:hypothetical protein